MESQSYPPTKTWLPKEMVQAILKQVGIQYGHIVNLISEAAIKEQLFNQLDGNFTGPSYFESVVVRA